MIREVSIKASGAYLIIIGIFLLGVFIFAFLTPGRAFHVHTPALQMRIIFPLFALWPLVTGAGILLKKNWARISVILMSIFVLFFGIFIMAGSFLFHSTRPFSIGPLLFLIVIPALFLVFFNRKSVEDLFLQGRPANKRPLGVTLIACYELLGSFGIILAVFSPNIKLPMSACWIIISIVSIYIGIGLLKLRKGAWWAAIIFQNIFIIWGIVNILRSLESTRYKILGALGMFLPLIILAYLLSRKKYFISSR